MVAILCQQRQQQGIKIAQGVDKVTYKLANCQAPSIILNPCLAFYAFTIIPHWQ